MLIKPDENKVSTPVKVTERKIELIFGFCFQQTKALFMPNIMNKQNSKKVMYLRIGQLSYEYILYHLRAFHYVSNNRCLSP